MNDISKDKYVGLKFWGSVGLLFTVVAGGIVGSALRMKQMEKDFAEQNGKDVLEARGYKEVYGFGLYKAKDAFEWRPCRRGFLARQYQAMDSGNHLVRPVVCFDYGTEPEVSLK